MPGIIQLQRQYSPWERQLPNFLANLTYQTMGQRFREQQANKRRQEREEQALRAYQSAGYREVVGEPGGPGEVGGVSYKKPTLSVGGKALVEPEKTWETRIINGRLYQVPITTKYGERGKQSGPTTIKKLGGKFQAKTRYIKRNNNIYAQDYNFDPETGQRVKSGPEYLSKIPGGTTVNIGDKLALHEGKQKITAKVKKIAAIESPKFRSVVSDQLKKLHGNDWQYREPFEKEQAIFEEMNRQIKETYSDKRISFDEEKGGWYDLDTGKLLRKYDDPYKMKKGVAKSFRYHTSPIKDYLNK